MRERDEPSGGQGLRMFANKSVNMMLEGYAKQLAPPDEPMKAIEFKSMGSYYRYLAQSDEKAQDLTKQHIIVPVRGKRGSPSPR